MLVSSVSDTTLWLHLQLIDLMKASLLEFLLSDFFVCRCGAGQAAFKSGGHCAYIRQPGETAE